MARFIKDKYFEGKLSSKEYELTCVQEPSKGEYKDRIKVGQRYICSEIMASNWSTVYAVSLGAGGMEVPKRYFEALPDLSQ